jgi:hypothetical protein
MEETTMTREAEELPFKVVRSNGYDETLALAANRTCRRTGW